MTAVSDPPERTPATSIPPRPENYRRKLLFRTILSLAVGAVFVWYMRGAGFNLAPRRSTFAHVRWWAVGCYFVMYGVVHYFRAMRWEYLLRPIAHVPRRRIIAIAFIGFLAILLLPFRMGEVVRPYLVREKGKISVSAGMGTIAAERVLDGLYVAVLLALALALVPRRPLEGVMLGNLAISAVPRLGYLAVVFFGSALTVLAFFLWQRALAEKLTDRIVGIVSKKLAARLSGIVGGLADGLRSLPDPKLMLPFTFYSAVYWCVNALAMWFLGWACGLDMTPGQGFAVMGVLAMGILLPAAPGMFGAFQLAIYAALLMYFPREQVMDAGAAYVFLMYLLQTLFHVIAGVVPMITEKISVVDAFSGGQAHEAPHAPPTA